MKKINLPRICERFLGISHPENGIFFAIDHDEVYKVRIGSLDEPEFVDECPYKFLKSLKNYVGINSPEPILQSGENTISYKFSSRAKEVEVKCKVASSVHTINFPILSGDWFIATFSVCGNYIIMAEPYELKLYSVGASD